MLESSPIAVKEKERLVLKGLVRTLGYADRLHVFDRSRTHENEKLSAVDFSLKPSDSTRAFYRVTQDESDGGVYRFEYSFAVPAKTEQIVLDILVKGYAWLGDVQVLRGEENLLKNGNFDQPMDEDGMHPDWRLAAIMGGGPAYADDEGLYLLRGNDLYVYDLKSKRKFPVSKVAAQTHATSDSPVAVYVRQEEKRSIDQGAHHGHPLPFAPREPRGPEIAARGQPDAVHQCLCPVRRRPALVLRASRQCRDQHILKHRALRQQVMKLKDKTQFAVTNPREFLIRQLTQVPAAQPNHSLCRPVQRPRDIQQRAFPRPRWPGNGDRLPSRDADIHSGQNWNR